MSNPGAVITLQYPDLWEGTLRIMASTRNNRALLAFRQAVLEEAQLKLMSFVGDEVLQIDYRAEYERLRKILDILIPEQEDESRNTEDNPGN